MFIPIPPIPPIPIAPNPNGSAAAFVPAFEPLPLPLPLPPPLPVLPLPLLLLVPVLAPPNPPPPNRAANGLAFAFAPAPLCDDGASAYTEHNTNRQSLSRSHSAVRHVLCVAHGFGKADAFGAAAPELVEPVEAEVPEPEVEELLADEVCALFEFAPPPANASIIGS